MKKKSGSRIGKLFKRIFNIRLWLDWDRLKSLTLAFFYGAKNLFIPKKNTASESFDEAMSRLKITEADLRSKQNGLFWLSILMVTAAAFIFFYAGYQLFYGSFKATIVSLVVMMLALVLAFRYNFWYFQIKKHKLGCSVREWYRQGLMGEKE